MKNILFVHFGDNHIRGSERCLIDLISHMDRRKFRPILWCNNSVLAEHINKNIPDIDTIVDDFFVLFGYTKPRFSLIKYFGLRNRAKKIIRENSIDLVHVNSAAPCQWMAPVCKSLKIPIVCHLHSSYLTRNRITLRVHETSALIGVSENILLEWRNDGYIDENIHCIHNGVDVKRLNQDPPWSIRKILHIPDNHLVLATVCSLVYNKGVDLLILSLEILIKQGIKVHLLIVGNGAEKDNLEQLAQKKELNQFVHFLGERNDVGAILSGGVDVLVSGSREEAFGLTLVEAAFAGLPVSAYAVAGIPEVVLHNITGLLAKFDDFSEMAKHWIILTDVDIRTRMGKAGELRANKEFSVQTYVNHVSQVWSNLLDRPLIFGKIPWRRLVKWIFNKVQISVR